MAASATSATHAAIPHDAITIENGRSLRNCPKNSAPTARFPASGSLSDRSSRCLSFNTNIVIRGGNGRAASRNAETCDGFGWRQRNSADSAYLNEHSRRRSSHHGTASDTRDAIGKRRPHPPVRERLRSHLRIAQAHTVLVRLKPDTTYCNGSTSVAFDTQGLKPEARSLEPEAQSRKPVSRLSA